MNKKQKTQLAAAKLKHNENKAKMVVLRERFRKWRPKHQSDPHTIQYALAHGSPDKKQIQHDLLILYRNNIEYGEKTTELPVHKPDGSQRMLDGAQRAPLNPTTPQL